MLNFAIQTARDAGRLLAERFGRSLRVTNKSELDLVTESDLASERMIIDRIKTYYPRHAILAEESGASGPADRAAQDEWRWIIDPLDGTTNYAHGLPIFSVSIALEIARRVELGVAYNPSLDELYVAERGRGATVNDQLIAVSTTATLEQSLLTTGFPYDIRETQQNNLAQYAAFAMRSRGVRRLGSAVLDLAWVAAGRLDGLWELRLGAWDVAAASLFVEEAGGRISNLVGDVMNLDAPAVVASNGRIHDEMLAVLREIRGARGGGAAPDG